MRKRESRARGEVCAIVSFILIGFHYSEHLVEIGLNEKLKEKGQNQRKEYFEVQTLLPEKQFPFFIS